MTNAEPPMPGEYNYEETTSSRDYGKWDWYRSMRRAMEESKKPDWKPLNELALGQPLPVGLGVGYCKWVMETPEVSDIIFRRFVAGDYENETEVMLLRAASFYYLQSVGYSVRHYSKLSGCWHDIAGIIKGEYSSAASRKLRQRLLLSVNNFQEN